MNRDDAPKSALKAGRVGVGYLLELTSVEECRTERGEMDGMS